MGIPDFQTCMLPLLSFASDGLPHQLKDAIDSLAAHFSLTLNERTQLRQSGGQTVFENRVSWARTFLKQAGLLKYPGRGMLQITEEGKRVVNSGVQTIDMNLLARYPSFAEFRKRTKVAADIPTGPNPDQLEELLGEFAELADKWFAERPFVVEYWKFMHDFFLPENLEKADWSNIQLLGDHIHSLQSYKIAKANAFGNPNYPIEQYRKSFHALAHGEGSVEERMRWFLTDNSATSKYLGASSVSEIMGQLHADTHVLFNKRDQEAAQYLGMEPGFSRGDDAARRFAKFNQAIQPIFSAYQMTVGKRTEVPIGLEVDQFFSWLYETKDISKRPPELNHDRPKIWEFAPGKNAIYWEQFYKDGVAAIGWNKIVDLHQFSSRDEIADAIKKEINPEAEPRNDSLALWQFYHDVKPGDIILAKKGRRTLVGLGVVEGEYEYRNDRPDYKHVRRVRWEQKGNWSLPEGLNLTTKTLTDLSPYPDHVAKLRGLITIPPPPPRRYWWINCNPAIWDIEKATIGHREIFGSYNANGNKRQKYKYFEEVKPGDEVLAYVTSPVHRLTGLLVVSKGLDETSEGEGIELELKEHFDTKPGWDALQKDDRLTECEPLRSNQGTIFSLTENEFAVIRELIDGETPIPGPYTVEEALVDLYMSEDTFRDIIERLKVKRNVILQGPPGVGKTFVARRVAYALLEEKDEERVRMVQFHQSYSYEDFVRGYRPSENGGFILKDGIFFEFCLRARADERKRPHVFIIDEINRGNLSKILGELMMLIEHDKRNRQYAVPLVYRKDGENNFFVPGNVYIIGLMNTADRSLAMVDYALRRRFSFIGVSPAFAEKKFTQRLIKMAGDGLGERIADIFIQLNKKIIEDDKNLGAGFCIGHSYFCLAETDLLDRKSYHRIIETEVAPLLLEYWFDQPKTATEWIERLKAVAG